MLAESRTLLPHEIDTPEVERERQSSKDCRLRQEWKCGQRQEQKRHLWTVEVLQVDIRGAADYRAYPGGECLVIVELIGVPCGDQACGDGKLKKVLKLDVPRAIENSRRSIVDRARSPKRDGEQNRVATNAAPGEPCR